MRSALLVAGGLGLLACGSKSDPSADDRSARPVADATAGDARPQPTLEELTRGMVHIPAGPFWYGCPKERIDLPWLAFPDGMWVNCVGRAVKRHLSFYIDRTEVTVEQYRQCVDAGACPLPDPVGERCDETERNWNVVDRGDHPINCVDWEHAEAYCAFHGHRLATSAEWEMAARGSDGRFYPWGNAPPSCDLAVISAGKWNEPAKRGCGARSTAAVGSRPKGASPYGVLDMAGNVMEIVVDVHPAHTDGKRPQPRDFGAITTRGGSYHSTFEASDLVTWANNIVGDDAKVGFRCAYSP